MPHTLTAGTGPSLASASASTDDGALFYPSVCTHERLKVRDLYLKPDGAAAAIGKATRVRTVSSYGDAETTRISDAMRKLRSLHIDRSDNKRERMVASAFRSLCNLAGISHHSSCASGRRRAVRVFLKGTYGSTYVIHGAEDCARLSRYLMTAGTGVDQIGGRLRGPYETSTTEDAVETTERAPSKALVKVQLLTDEDQRTEAFHEDSIHHYIQKQNCRIAESYNMHGRDIVPAFYTGATVVVPAAAASHRTPAAVLRIRIMEFVEGLPLCQAVDQQMRSPQNDAACLARGCALLYSRMERMLMFLWSLGISHGDLHDSNILISYQGLPRIIDLGFAVTLERKASAILTKRMASLPRKFVRGQEAYPHRLYICAAQRNVSHVLHQRGYRTYNHDAAVLVCTLKRLGQLCTKAGVSFHATLQTSRRRLWSAPS